MVASPTINLAGMNASAQRTAHHFVEWLRHSTANPKHQGRYETVVGEGKVKVAHVTWTVPPEDMMV
jgi:hypothetical protein